MNIKHVKHMMILSVIILRTKALMSVSTRVRLLRT